MEFKKEAEKLWQYLMNVTFVHPRQILPIEYIEAALHGAYEKGQESMYESLPQYVCKECFERIRLGSKRPAGGEK